MSPAFRPNRPQPFSRPNIISDTVRTATNWITISVTNAVGAPQSISVSGGSIVINFAGVPGFAYDVMRATNVLGPWTVLATTNAPAAGLWQATDSSPPTPAGFYRTKQH